MIVNFDEFNSIPGIFYHQANNLKDQPYLWKKENDKYVSLSWSQVKEQVESLATYLKDLGILEGDRVLILSENRPEWQITDLAICQQEQQFNIQQAQLMTINILLSILVLDVPSYHHTS